VISTAEQHIPARDGFPLAATVTGTGSRTVVINSATAVPRRYYATYAQALAAEGYTVVTYDYRGIGGSRPASLRGFAARARDWVLLDMAGVVDFAAGLGGGEVFLVGHSIGGQLAGLLDNADRVSAMITVSAQSGHWRLQGRGQRLPVALHTHLVLPFLVATLGYVPWSRFSSAEDLPGGVAREWARWCRDPRYLLGDDTLPLQRYRDFTAPVLAYSVADDAWGTARSVDTMMAAYPDVQRRHLLPADHGLGHVGHFGFFRRTAQPLWQQTFAWLDERSTPEQRFGTAG
jgi:predicted alpha/beta hydrolase